MNPQGANLVINLLAGNENLEILGDVTEVGSSSELVASDGTIFTGGTITGGTPLVGVDPVNPGNY